MITPNESKPARVSITTKQAEDAPCKWHWVERAEWTDRMLNALETGVKGTCWFSLIDKVQAIRRVYIPKPGSKEKRPLGIPTDLDRVVQAAVRSVIEPIFERDFAPNSYGFRPGLGCKDALRRVDTFLKSGYQWVVDLDIRKYFDSIPHGKLMELIAKRIGDSRVLNLIEQYLKQPVFEELQTWIPEEGSPQGAVLSPLLANIYLSPLDMKMAGNG